MIKRATRRKPGGASGAIGASRHGRAAMLALAALVARAFSGTYPALRAASLQPVDALRAGT